MPKITLVSAIHHLKTTFRKRFGDTFSIQSLEAIINAAAIRVKKGELFEWYEENERPMLRFSAKPRWVAQPSTHRGNKLPKTTQYK